MARANGGFTGSLLFVAQKAFVAGCFGCLGVGSTAVVVFFLVFGVFQSQFVAIVKTLPIPAVFPVQPTLCPTASALTSIEIFVTQENNPAAVRITQVKLPVQQPLFICVQNPKGVTSRFTVRITLPGNQVALFGSEFTADPLGKPFCLAPWTDFPNVPGVFRIDAVVGTTIVGSTVLTAVQ